MLAINCVSPGFPQVRALSGSPPSETAHVSPAILGKTMGFVHKALEFPDYSPCVF